ncbi:protein of unknown function (plasmid) [Caballeronia sp. S22]
MAVPANFPYPIAIRLEIRNALQVND